MDPSCKTLDRAVSVGQYCPQLLMLCHFADSPYTHNSFCLNYLEITFQCLDVASIRTI